MKTMQDALNAIKNNQPATDALRKAWTEGLLESVEEIGYKYASDLHPVVALWIVEDDEWAISGDTYQKSELLRDRPQLIAVVNLRFLEESCEDLFCDVDEHPGKLEDLDALIRERGLEVERGENGEIELWSDALRTLWESMSYDEQKEWREDTFCAYWDRDSAEIREELPSLDEAIEAIHP